MAQQAKTRPQPARSNPPAGIGLASAGPATRHSKGTEAKARQLAGQTIDRLTDATAPPEEQAKRKRRLTKGPPEFREMRVDLPKAKPGR